MKLRLSALPDPCRPGGQRNQEPPRCQGLAQPSDGRRMVRRGMATYAVIDWDGDDEALPRSIKHITPGQANDPRYQRQQSGEIVLLVPPGRPNPEAERRMARRRDALAMHLLASQTGPTDDLVHYCRTGHARNLQVLAQRPPRPDPDAAEALRAAGQRMVPGAMPTARAKDPGTRQPARDWGHGEVHVAPGRRG